MKKIHYSKDATGNSPYLYGEIERIFSDTQYYTQVKEHKNILINNFFSYLRKARKIYPKQKYYKQNYAIIDILKE